MKRTVNLAVAVVICTLLAAASNTPAVPMSVPSSATGAGTDVSFDGFISSTDLVNTGQATLTSATIGTPPGFGFPGINNGLGGTNVNDSTFIRKVDTPVSVTFDLNTALNPNGYSLTQLATFAGWTGVNITQANQKYEVLVSRVGDTSFSSLGTFTNAPFAAASNTGSSTHLVITDSTGTLAGNVDRVRFNLIYPGFDGNNNNPGTVYRELDVFGAASALGITPRVNLIQNGSFETVALGAGASQLFTTGNPSISNWTINGEVTLVRGTFNTVASDGAQWLSLESNGSAQFPNNDGTVSQTIATVIGDSYDLIFDYTVLGNNTVNTPWELIYNVGTGPKSIFIDNVTNLTIGAWQTEAFRFTATSNLTTISFSGIAKVNGFFGPAIDNVAVFIVTPEPTTAMLGLLAVAGLMGRRRRVA
ncbi:MAG: DUF642 domain-containing protein [Phycisphaeraceae bacterium]